RRRMSEAATPAALGYRMPAEWEPHAATWLAWPHARGDWPGKFETVAWVFAEVVRHLVAGEGVRILVDDARMQRRAGDLLRREGGAVDVNGRGTVLATEECLLSRVQARNPGVRRDAIERLLGAYLGVRKVLWLGRGIAGDDTHGHVDDVARFVDERTVVIAEERDPSDPNYEPLRDNRARLARMTDQDGRRLRVVPLPMPSPVIFAGQRLPASYANF